MTVVIYQLVHRKTENEFFRYFFGHIQIVYSYILKSHFFPKKKRILSPDEVPSKNSEENFFASC
jgi:predicted AlkP superfamily pyrophosphatase or phosphodiesterase